MFYYDTNLEFKGATLLSADEASNLLTVQGRKNKDYWWLRTPGHDSSYACIVSRYGSVSYYGSPVRTNFGIRPALMLSNLGTFKVGDIFNIEDYYFKIISPNLAWLYKQDIGGKEDFDAKSNDYETSHVKQVVDAWYEELRKDLLLWKDE